MTNATIPFFILHFVIYISVCLLPYGVLGLWRPYSALSVGNTENRSWNKAATSLYISHSSINTTRIPLCHPSSAFDSRHTGLVLLNQLTTTASQLNYIKTTKNSKMYHKRQILPSRNLLLRFLRRSTYYIYREQSNATSHCINHNFFKSWENWGKSVPEVIGNWFLEPLEQSKILKNKLDLYRGKNSKGHHE